MVYDHAQSHPQARNTSFTRFDLVPCGSTPPFSFLDSCHWECSNFFNFLTSFGFPTFLPSIDLTLPFAHRIPFDHRSSLAMPYPKQRSHYSQVFYVVAVAYYRCRQILTSERKSWRSATPQAPPHPRTCSCQPPTPTPSTLCSFQRSMACEIRN